MYFSNFDLCLIIRRTFVFITVYNISSICNLYFVLVVSINLRCDEEKDNKIKIQTIKIYISIKINILELQSSLPIQ